MLKIWGRANAPNVQKVLWACEELSLAYERIDLGGPFGGGDAPAYREKNPNGTVPTLEDGDFVIWESHAILRYLAGKTRSEALYPIELRRRGVIDQWLDWQAAQQALAVRALVKAGDPAQLETARQAAEPLFALLNRRLLRSAHVAGNDFTLADIPNAIGAQRWMSLPIERPALTALQDWLGQLSERPAFRRLAG
jgi:glutathione S-transferase